MAARYTKPDVCKMLIEHGADINARNWAGGRVSYAFYSTLVALNHFAELLLHGLA
jgi:Ankyrin repeat